VLTASDRLRVINTHTTRRTRSRTNVRAAAHHRRLEHAYYVDYQNERERYISSYLEHLVNWDFAREELSARPQALDAAARTRIERPCGSPRLHRSPMSVPPRLYGGTERVVAYLSDELVGMGHDVTLFRERRLAGRVRN
jgi:hypothetical protein